MSRSPLHVATITGAIAAAIVAAPDRPGSESSGVFGLLAILALAAAVAAVAWDAARARGSVAEVASAVRHAVRWAAVHVALGTGLYAFGRFDYLPAPDAAFLPGPPYAMAAFAAVVAGGLTLALGLAMAPGWARVFARGAASEPQVA